ncbi:MAG TPA: AbrB family transcriptional regulator [Alphaproteobacteria bacterium]|nr:AbrB family transcriptional regulator [Alphaproteobacteria bacterium]HAJ47288.1 AbrB family transcriptional regulator [Alphaproteobacteria bacterium]
MASTVTAKGQVTIPKAIRDKLKLKPGSKVAFTVLDTGLVTVEKEGDSERRMKAYKKRIESMIGTATSGMTTEEIMLLTRGRKI